MTARDFCYWLQGYFELTGPEASLTGDHVRTVRAHLDLVKRVDPKHSNAFVAWLAVRLTPPEDLTAEDVNEVRRLLASQFKHDIDKQYPGDPTILQAIHDGVQAPWVYSPIGSDGLHDQLLRC